ncbi:MAG: leucine-rich repeat domain-containing protein [Bernardetiaceae bacterium]
MKVIVIFCVGLIASMGGYAQTTNTPFARQDSAVLVALFQATDGANWLNPWPLREPITNWQGVARNSEGRVIQVQLNGRRLRGTLPPEMVLLQELLVIDLSNNQLQGNLNPFWAFEKLLSLNLSKNAFADTLSQNLSRLRNLRILDLSHNQLEGELPEALFDLLPLRVLHLSHNRFEGNLPPAIGQLTQLESLEIAHNQFRGVLPEQWHQLRRLQSLKLHHNNLTGTLPTTWGALASLKHLQINNNRIGGTIPDTWHALTQLTHVYLNNNSFREGIVPALNAWTQLRELYAQQNAFSDRFSEFRRRLPDLQKLDLSQNQLKGVLATAFSETKKLQYLNLSRNQLENILTVDIFTLGQLRYADLSHNQFVGSIPEAFSNLASLQFLNLSHNDLEGSLQNLLFGRLQALHTLNLSHNHFSGNIPRSINEAKNLQTLDLSYNKIEDGLDFLQNMPSLQTLLLSNNRFAGELPDSWQRNPALAFLDISHNRFGRSLPGSWQNLRRLHTLKANDNALDTVPVLGQMPQLRYLHLHNNRLTTLPAFPDSVFALVQLFVQNNRLTFKDLVPTRLAVQDFRYSPQAAPPTLGQCTLYTTSEADYNRYQWFRDSVAIEGDDGQVPRLVVRDTGMYFCEIENDSLPDLTLRSEVVFAHYTTPETFFPARDTAFCLPFRLKLDAGSGDRYTWNTGDTGRFVSADRDTIFAVLTERGPCSQSDTIRIAYYGARNNTLPTGQAICAGIVPLPLLGGFSDSLHGYRWEFSENLMDWQAADSQQVHQPPALQQTRYYRRWVITERCGEQVSDTLEVFVSRLRIQDSLRLPRCFGGRDGAIVLQPQDGLAPFVATWEERPDTGLVLSDIPAGAYTVSLRDSAGCSITETITLGQPEQVQFLPQITRPSCDTDSRNGSIRLQLTGGTAPYDVFWNVISTEGGLLVSNLGAGTYRAFVRDSLGCRAEASFVLEREPPPVADFDYEKDYFCTFEQQILPRNESDAGGVFSAAPQGLQIDPQTGEIDLSRSQAGRYNISLTFARCTQKTIALTLADDCLDQIPNAFTPNGDGLNDRWTIPLLTHFPEASVEIFNRNGQKVFQSQGYDEPWAGEAGKSGVYLYRIRFVEGTIKVGRLTVIP